MCRGGGFGCVVVAHEREHPAIFRSAGEIRVSEHVAGAIDPRALAVPEAEHAVELALPTQLGLLRSPQRRGGDVLVDAGQKSDVIAIELALRPNELLVERAQRRAAVARHIARGVETCTPVALLLHPAEPDQRLKPGHDAAALAEIVLVFKGDVIERYCAGLQARMRPRAGSARARRRKRYNRTPARAMARACVACTQYSVQLDRAARSTRTQRRRKLRHTSP